MIIFGAGLSDFMLVKNVFWFKSIGHKIQVPMVAQSADGPFSQLEF